MEISECDASDDYHKYEDVLAENVLRKLKWPLKKIGNRWVGADYESILTQGGFSDYDQKDLISAAAGRVKMARAYGQTNFQDMDYGHARTLGFLLTAILYHRLQFLVFEE